jgi:hypothetical protein
MANKLTTLGYFKKRMRDCGYIVDDLFRNYSSTDPRSWTVIIDPGNASVFCTCYVNANAADMKDSVVGDFYFELHDGGQYIPSKFAIKTSSIEVLMEYLVKFNINNKSVQYNNYKPQTN